MIIDGKATAAKIREDLKASTDAFYLFYEKVPCLAVIQVGSNPASNTYVNNKIKACHEIGFKSRSYHFADITTQGLMALIAQLNLDPEVHGILVQLPLPEHINERYVLEAISPEKDVDAFHPYNVGKLFEGEPDFVPCTPAGIMELLHTYNIDPTGKECVVVGRSNIVGKPIAQLLLQKNGTVTVCHSKTKNLEEVCKRADILICAIGKPKFFDEDYVKFGAVVIDVGINRDENGKLCGDVDFDSVKDIVSYITPVPGGCGPMTIAMLMKNTYHAALKLVGTEEPVEVDSKTVNTICMEGPNQFKTVSYTPTCVHGYADCVFDPAYIKATYPSWYIDLYGDTEPNENSCANCENGERYDDEDK
jgi:methylenetetrahydrofolate dehydrogenase (NADP+)/methenyltetrahydrofolate cyclohydrolase